MKSPVTYNFSFDKSQYRRTADMIDPETKVRIKDLDWLKRNCSKYDKDTDSCLFEFSSHTFCFSKKMMSYCGKEATVLGDLHHTGSDLFMLDIDNGQYGWSSICFDVVDNFKKSNLFSSSIDDYDIAHFEEFVLGICKTTGQAIPEFFMNPEEIKEYIIKNYG